MTPTARGSNRDQKNLMVLKDFHDYLINALVMNESTDSVNQAIAEFKATTNQLAACDVKRGDMLRLLCFDSAGLNARPSANQLNFFDIGEDSA